MAAVGVEVENNPQRERIIISDNTQQKCVFVKQLSWSMKVFRVSEWRTVEKAPPNNINFNYSNFSDAEGEDIHTPVKPVIENTVTQWQCSQWFSCTTYDYTQSGAFLDMDSGEQINDLIESGTLRLVDWNDSMTDIQLGMRFVNKVQAISAVQKWSIRVHQSKHRNMSSKFISRSISHLVANGPKIPVSNVVQEVQVHMDHYEEFVEENIGLENGIDPCTFEEFLEPEEYVDHGHLFATDQIFNSKPELVNWAKETTIKVNTYLIAFSI
ncbi:hypothetical protein M9H77_16396 [Catharanthus roseus]|uniref:Uncharacterized protein n=1 Tax=Catharanthus roseus TaxID=4058 RepID=A0ACC0B1N1_CATRO|nr:hypothetical protein M9H77_16396 [Catharanthus roseus]